MTAPNVTSGVEAKTHRKKGTLPNGRETRSLKVIGEPPAVAR